MAYGIKATTPSGTREYSTATGMTRVLWSGLIDADYSGGCPTISGVSRPGLAFKESISGECQPFYVPGFDPGRGEIFVFQETFAALPPKPEFDTGTKELWFDAFGNRDVPTGSGFVLVVMYQ